MNKINCALLVAVAFCLLGGCTNSDAPTQQQKAAHDALWKTSPASSATAGVTAGPLLPAAPSSSNGKN